MALILIYMIGSIQQSGWRRGGVYLAAEHLQASVIMT